MSEICVACNRKLEEFTDVPCTQCAYQHDPFAPEEGQSLDFNDTTFYREEPMDGTMGIGDVGDEDEYEI